jgi:hypothetical protein
MACILSDQPWRVKSQTIIDFPETITQAALTSGLLHEVVMDLDIYAQNPEPFLATIAELLINQGDTAAVAVLANCKGFIYQNGYYSIDGDSGYVINLEIPSRLYSQIQSIREQIEKKILTIAWAITRTADEQYIHAVLIEPEINEKADWRDYANNWVAGKGVTNQGRVRSDNIASRSCDGLLFRSQPEINLYKAFKKLGVSFAPLPVFIRGGESYRRIEPDFVIVKDGIGMVVEVDGDTIHQETPAEAHARTTMLLHEGIHFERVQASECDSAESAEKCACRLLMILRKVKETR